MAKVKWIPCDMWKRGIYVFIGTLKELTDWCFNKTKDTWSKDFLIMLGRLDERNIGAASYNYDNDGTGVILIPKMPNTPKEHAVLAHEILHSVFVMLDYCRVEYVQNSNNETFTYLDEHITRNALEKDGYIDAEKY